jgi:heme-degrading monooxygenase HmoA
MQKPSTSDKHTAMFITVFRNRKRPDIDGAAYSADAARMVELASRQPGFLSFRSYTADDGEVVAISEWADEASARAWGTHPDHAVVQAKGRSEYYAQYTSISADNPRVRAFRAEP